jgi:hypothetical protein
MRSIDLTKLLELRAENVRFENWNSQQSVRPRFVYACELGTIWKFTPKEWWQVVTKIVRNNGSHEFHLSKSTRRPKFILKTGDGSFQSTDPTMRSVNPANWTLDDWKRELL